MGNQLIIIIIIRLVFRQHYLRHFQTSREPNLRNVIEKLREASHLFTQNYQRKQNNKCNLPILLRWARESLLSDCKIRATPWRDYIFSCYTFFGKIIWIHIVICVPDHLNKWFKYWIIMCSSSFYRCIQWCLAEIWCSKMNESTGSWILNFHGLVVVFCSFAFYFL